MQGIRKASVFSVDLRVLVLLKAIIKYGQVILVTSANLYHTTVALWPPPKVWYKGLLKTILFSEIFFVLYETQPQADDAESIQKNLNCFALEKYRLMCPQIARFSLESDHNQYLSSWSLFKRFWREL